MKNPEPDPSPWDDLFASASTAKPSTAEATEVRASSGAKASSGAAASKKQKVKHNASASTKASKASKASASTEARTHPLTTLAAALAAARSLAKKHYPNPPPTALLDLPTLQQWLPRHHVSASPQLTAIQTALPSLLPLLTIPPLPPLLTVLHALDAIYYPAYYLSLLLIPTLPRSLSNYRKHTPTLSPCCYLTNDKAVNGSKHKPLTTLRAIVQAECDTICALPDPLPSPWDPKSYYRTLALALAKTPSAGTFTHALHDVPSPAPLSLYRELHRRWGCHLYCYATLGSKALDVIANASQHQTRIVEIGCGTGYLLAQLASHCPTLSLLGIDISPPNLTPNAYHGSIPSHVPTSTVLQGDIETLQAAEVKPTTTLLLCYPCPDNSMGVDAVEEFARLGGNTLVYVGEWRGVTGTQALEDRLERDWLLTSRGECGRWGVNCDEVMVWRLKKKEQHVTSVGLKCVQCEKRGRWRVVWGRDCVYCGKDCFEKDAQARSERGGTWGVPKSVWEGVKWGEKAGGLVDLHGLPRY